MTPVEIDAYWVSESEIHQAMRDASSTAALLQSGQIDTDVPGHCVLGLEAHTPHGKERRQHLLRGSIDTVLADQAEVRQEELFRHIPVAQREDMIATMYRYYSRQASEEAHLRALQTAFDVEDL